MAGVLDEQLTALEVSIIDLNGNIHALCSFGEQGVPYASYITALWEEQYNWNEVNHLQC